MTVNTGRSMTTANLASTRTSLGRYVPLSVNNACFFLSAPPELQASKNLEDDSMRSQKPCAKLENWAVVESANVGSYQALQAGNLLVGKVFNHPRIGAGTFIFSSPIVGLDTQAKIVETRNTSYRLGQASRDYETWTEEQKQTGAAA
jgi:hypothetical protein